MLASYLDLVALGSKELAPLKEGGKMEEEEDEKAKESSKNVRRSKYLYKGIKFCFWYFIIFEG